MAAAVLVGAVGLGRYFYAQFEAAQQEKALLRARAVAWLQLRDRIREELLAFHGKSGVIVRDLKTGWELSHNRSKPFASASLAKLPIMVALLQAAEAGQFSLDQEITLKSSDKLEGSGDLKSMPSGASFGIGKLITLMIADSDNTATEMLTKFMGQDTLNAAFERYGLEVTRLNRHVADYVARDRRDIENYTTAEEMASLLDQIYHRKLVSRNVSDQCITTLKLSRTNDRIPRYLPPELSVAHKTGLENGVCHDAGILFSPEGDLIVVVLTNHNDATHGRAKELIGRVARLSYEYLGSWKPAETSAG